IVEPGVLQNTVIRRCGNHQKKRISQESLPSITKFSIREIKTYWMSTQRDVIGDQCKRSHQASFWKETKYNLLIAHADYRRRRRIEPVHQLDPEGGSPASHFNLDRSRKKRY